MLLEVLEVIEAHLVSHARSADAEAANSGDHAIQAAARMKQEVLQEIAEIIGEARKEAAMAMVAKFCPDKLDTE